MTQYICKLPTPIKAMQVQEGGQNKFIDVDTLFFKEPSVGKLKCDFRYTRNAFKKAYKQAMQELRESLQGHQENTTKKEIENVDDVITEEKALMRGYEVLESLDSLDVDLYQIPLENAFKTFLTKGSCYKMAGMEEVNKLTMDDIEAISDDNFEVIFAMYLGYFLDFFILRNPVQMKKYFA